MDYCGPVVTTLETLNFSELLNFVFERETLHLIRRA
jgi:hypothetical protein